MRIETTTNHEDVAQPRPKVWLTADDYAELLRHADSYRDDLILRLGGDCGLRSFEITYVRPDDIKPAKHADTGHFLRVVKGKDTTGHGGKARDAYLPEALERDMRRYANAEDIGGKEPFFDVSPRTIQRTVKRAAARAADETGDDDYRKVTSHDLRRYFAHTALVTNRMNPRVVMDVGGWDDYKSLEPYLSKPDEDTIIGEFQNAGMD